MAKTGTITWTGSSGVEYEFDSYSWDSEIDAGAGVYVVTRRRLTEEGLYKQLSIYVGQTDDLGWILYDHPMGECFAEHGANCLCVFRTDVEEMRLKIQSDLVSRYRPRCNSGSGDAEVQRAEESAHNR